MKTFMANRCLFIATISLVTAPLPLAAIAQEEAPIVGQAAPQEIPQRRFVSDKLVLNVYAEADQGSARVATIQSGDFVEELERTANLVRVRLEDGREGWVGANYLTSDPPAATRLRELQRQQKPAARSPDKEFAEEIARLKKDNAALQAQVSKLQATAAAAITPARQSAQTVPTSASEVVNAEGKVVATAPGSKVGWGWLIAMVLTGAVGFAGGYQTLARRIRKKFGGLQIY